MNEQHIQTLIIGAGQAGLATAYHLTRRGSAVLVVDGNERIGDNWRQQWDTLRLYTPAKYDGLPGLPFPGEPWHYPGKEEVADYLERYAATFDLPVRTHIRVQRLERHGDGFRAELEDGSITCDNVVVATGTFGRTPYVPDVAAQLDPDIVQLHSSEYRRPQQLPNGTVLVVGASHSGTDVAFEVAQTRPTVLAGRDCGDLPVHLESRQARLFFPVILQVFRHVLTRRTPMGRKEMDEVRFHGGPSLRVKHGDLAARGVQRNEARVVSAEGGRPLLADGTVVDAASVVWCTGFQQVFDWIDLPVFDDRGWPREYRGVVDEAPGLFFCGLSFQYAFASMILPGVGRDAEYVARQIVRRNATLDRREPAAA
jgi:putative flavoprotein involved in K+ transport